MERMTERLVELYDFWFGKAVGFPEKGHADRWFMGGDAFDGELRIKFLDLCGKALAGEMPDDCEELDSAKEALALLLLYDQLPRNLFRNSAKAFSGDERALTLSRSLISTMRYSGMHSHQKLFVLMPLMHSERLSTQNTSLRMFYELWQDNLETDQAEMFKFSFAYAEKHRAIIDRFGRYPHRNAALGRKSTPEEIEYLRTADRFGQ